jgi:hypothetical protein
MKDEALHLVREYEARGPGFEVKDNIPMNLREQLESLGYVD